MARSYAPILTSIWADPEFRALSADAQRVYVLAFSQANTSYAGVVPYTARRWAGMAGDTTPADIDKAVDELVERRFVVLDDETEELWIRSFVKHNGVLSQPQLRKAMHKAYGDVLSPSIRAAFLDQLPEPDKSLLAGPKQPSGTLPEGCPSTAGQEPSSSPSPGPTSSPSPPANGDDDEEVLNDAAALIAERLLALRVRSDKGPVSDPDAWLAKVTADRSNRNRDRALRILADNPDLAADELADLLEPTLTNRRPAERDRSCPDCAGTTYVLDDDQARPCPRCRS